MMNPVADLLRAVPEFAVARRSSIELHGAEPYVVFGELAEFVISEFRSGKIGTGSAFQKGLFFFDQAIRSSDPEVEGPARAALLSFDSLEDADFQAFRQLISKDWPALARSVDKILGGEKGRRARSKGRGLINRLRASIPEFEEAMGERVKGLWDLPDLVLAELVRYLAREYERGRTTTYSPLCRALQFLDDEINSGDRDIENLVCTGFLESLHVAGEHRDGLKKMLGRNLKRLLKRLLW